MLHFHDHGNQDDSLFRIMYKEPKAKIYEGLGQVTYLFKAVPGK